METKSNEPVYKAFMTLTALRLRPRLIQVVGVEDPTSICQLEPCRLNQMQLPIWARGLGSAMLPTHPVDVANGGLLEIHGLSCFVKLLFG